MKHPTVAAALRTRHRLAVAAVAAGVALAAPGSLSLAQTAPTDSTPSVSVGAFVDGYFAWDFGRPPAFDRSFAGGTPFTTQPARHNEFNVNLAFVEARLEAPHYRGRLALQAGTSVQSNYAGEPETGRLSGASLSRTLQEAVVGVKLADAVWLDAGIFYSNVGMESWASRDNLTYTRSLVADYSPYYQSGVKLTWTPTAKLAARVDVINGWQNIAESNAGKAAGLRLDYALSARNSISYYNLTRLRVFQGVGVRHSAGRLTVLGSVDVGRQSRGRDVDAHSTWYGWAAILRVQATSTVALAMRAEGYEDADQVIVGTGSYARSGQALPAPNPALRAVGGSLGVDVTPYARISWRSEFRGWRNRERLFPDGVNGFPSRVSVVAVSSLSLSF
jgi:Putative beta-barrel porin-2, OmpL-like. bbp2